MVWKHLDPATLRPSERRRLLVPSGLYGVTTGEDLVADYRLGLKVRLEPMGNLATFWRPRLTPVLDHFPRDVTVVNLLPREHEAAFDFDHLATMRDVVKVTFLSSSGAGAAGHAAKAVKGVLARQLLLDGLGVLDSFAWEGWRARHHRGQVSVMAPH